MPANTEHNLQKLGVGLLTYASGIDRLESPEAVLDGLHKVTAEFCQLKVLGAHMFPLRWGDWSGVEIGKTVFLHKSTPRGWWDEYVELSQRYPAAGYTIAQLSLAPFTMSEIMRMLAPLGVERWPYELALKYGMRDSLTCPIGGRWVLAYWSHHVLDKSLSAEARAIVFMGATFAVIRLQNIVNPQAGRIGRRPLLTPRELAVLRSMSVGNQVRETAELLGLGEETVRTHLKNAQGKLGVSNRTHAVAQALRRQLIP